MVFTDTQKIRRVRLAHHKTNVKDLEQCGELWKLRGVQHNWSVGERSEWHVMISEKPARTGLPGPLAILISLDFILNAIGSLCRASDRI